MRRLELRMHRREKSRQQTVARHREPDACLPVLEDEQRREHARQRANHDDRSKERLRAEGLQRVSDRRVGRRPRGEGRCTRIIPSSTSATPM